MQPSRGEIWTVNLESAEGHEQGGEKRSSLVVSVNEFNHGPADLVTILPITKVFKGIPFHVAVDPPEGGLVFPSFIKCEDIRSISKNRLQKRLGKVTRATMIKVEESVKMLLFPTLF